MSAEEYVPVCDVADLEDEGRTVVQQDGQAIPVFYHEGEAYAVDNRCPHMGFPLVRGTVDEGVLTCHRHYADITGILIQRETQYGGRLSDNTTKQIQYQSNLSNVRMSTLHKPLESNRLERSIEAPQNQKKETHTNGN